MDFTRARVRRDAEAQSRYVRIPESGAVEGASLGDEGTVEAIVQLSVTSCDPGRCAICRDNARTRFVVKQSDAHGVKKWCGMCLAEKLAIEASEVSAS